jgi:hypothetical protein
VHETLAKYGNTHMTLALRDQAAPQELAETLVARPADSKPDATTGTRSSANSATSTCATSA